MNGLFNNIYRGKRVFITGHTGFKGSWLALWLTRLGAKVVGYSLDIPTNPSHFKLLRLKLTSYNGDILDREKLKRTIRAQEPDIVFHLAAQPLVRDSYLNPVKTFETNIIGTVNLLESCREARTIKAIVNITSDKCYQNNESGQAYREDDPLGGSDPYSASKACAELVSNAYRRSFFNHDEYGESHHLLLANARAGNTIGGGDWAKDRLISDVVKAVSKCKVAVIRNPRAERPWQHVLEPLSGYLHLGWKLLEGQKEFADNWNFGPDNNSSLTVIEAVKNVKDYWDKVRYKIKEDKNSFPEANFLRLDSSKARKKLGWKSVWDSRTAFEKTASWYKNFYQSAKIASREDLDQYVSDARRVDIEWAKE